MVEAGNGGDRLQLAKFREGGSVGKEGTARGEENISVPPRSRNREAQNYGRVDL